MKRRAPPPGGWPDGGAEGPPGPVVRRHPARRPATGRATERAQRARPRAEPVRRV